MSVKERGLLMSVVAVTPDNLGTLRHALRALAAQTARARLELVLVVPSKARLGTESRELSSFGSWQIVEKELSDSIAPARAAGVRAATAPLVSFLEDHVTLHPEWAQRLIEAHGEGEWAAVGPSVANASLESPTGWANLVLAYGPWLGAQTRGERGNVPAHASAYRRDLLLAYGDDLAAWLESEMPMQDDLRARGHRFLLEPAARVSHLSISKLSSYASEQYNAGRLYGSFRSETWPLLRRLAYAAGSPLVPAKRFPELLGAIRRAGLWSRLAPGVLPPLALGLVLHSVGEMAGYVLGRGRSAARTAALEFHHELHLSAGERARYAAAPEDPGPAR